MSLLRPLAPLLLKVRERNGKEDPRRRPERLGRASAGRPEGVLAWVHAASVGETNAVLPVIEALCAARPDLSVLLTTGTVTSAGLAERRLPERMPAPVRAARCARVRGKLPRPLAPRPRRVHRIGDLAVADPRDVGTRAFRWRSSTRACRTAAGGAGSATRAWRSRCSTASTWCWRRTSASPWASRCWARATCTSVGNLKIDAPPPPVDLAELERLRQALDGRPGFVAASTHEGEEEIIAEAHRELGAHLRQVLHHHRPAPSRARHRRSPSGSRIWGCRWRSARSAPCRTSAPTSTSPTPSASSARSTRSRPSPSSAARSSSAAGRTRSRRSATASPCSPDRTGRTSAMPTARFCATRAPSRWTAPRASPRR